MTVRETILAAGVALLREQGIPALTQPRVAKAAGVRQSHLTYYFSTRDELLLAIAKETVREATATLASRVEPGISPATLALALSEVMIAGVPARAMLGLVVAADADPEIRKPLRKLIRHIRGVVQELLAKAGIACDAESALVFHATVVGLVVMHQARMEPASAREMRLGVAAMVRLLAPARRTSTKGSS